ncbi:MAG TPA: hypothetical protein VIJ29_03210 [Candidatus Paceibacterota bacterium]
MRTSKGLLSALVVTTSFLVASFFVMQTIFAANLTSQVVVGSSAPAISSVSVNGGTSITLSPNTTTNINVNATISDANGCSEITTGTTTVLLYRSGVTSSTCSGTANNLDCYIATAFTASSTCSGGTQNTTTTFALEYFAQATDVTSSFSGQSWMATVLFRTPDNTTNTADSAGVTLSTLTAINVTTSSINYGTITANTNTGATNQLTAVANAGNSSSSLQLSAQATLTSGSNSIATSSQGYSTSTFSYPGTSTALSATPATVAGYILTAPTSTTNVSGTIYWGLGVPNATPTGTYSGTNVFSALFHG